MAKDTIISNGKLRGAKEATTVIVTEGGNFNALDAFMSKGLREMAQPGKSLAAFKKAYDANAKAVQAHKAPRQEPTSLATGLTGRNAPHSSKAVGDNNRAASKGAAKAPAAPKAPAAKKDAPASRSADHGQKLTVLVKAKDSGLRPDSGRYVKLLAAEKAKTVGDWLGKEVSDATGAMHKCDRGALGGMIKRGHVKIG